MIRVKENPPFFPEISGFTLAGKPLKKDIQVCIIMPGVEPHVV